MWSARVLIAALSTSGLMLSICNTGQSGRNPDGTFNVGSREVNTGRSIDAGSVVRVKANGEVNFGGGFGEVKVGDWVLVAGAGAPNLDADGDSWPTPGDYPAPSLRKNSLICRVGSSPWKQCGRNEYFRTQESGILILRPNDKQLEDNSGAWTVAVSTNAPGDEALPDKFSVLNHEVPTGLTIRAGSKVRVLSSGVIDFGGAVLGLGAPIKDADGDDEVTPGDYPAPGLHKNSLICKVGSPPWEQCGTDATFQSKADGELILQPNDKDLLDNSRGWKVTVVVTPQ